MVSSEGEISNAPSEEGEQYDHAEFLYVKMAQGK
jgi:hypothetical protein